MSSRSILTLMSKVLGNQFAGETWDGWRVLLKAMFALPLTDAELEAFEELTGRSTAPTVPAREVWAIAGRRGGKSIIAALVAVYLTTCRTYKLARGEVGTFMVIAADRRQARVVARYIKGLLHSTPVLEQLIAHETKTEIQLANGLSIEIHSASFRSVRGYTVVGAILDEIAFWPTDDAANPDREILAALRPAMATVPGAMLLCVSSPYARKGELYRAHRDHYGVDGDVLVVQAETRLLNPAVPQEIIDRAYEVDPVAAVAEYGAQFRTDVSGFISREVVDGCTVVDRHELPPVLGVSYSGFVDFAGGSGQDSATLAIAHREFREERSTGVLDLVREVRPPFSPEQVCRDFAGDLKRYRVTRATADRYAADFATEAMRRQGIDLKAADKAKSDLYREFLPALNSGGIELLDLPRLAAQLGGLERRVARGGRDSIDHAPGGHDDVANAVAGALVAVADGKRRRWGVVLSPKEFAATGCADTSSLVERAQQLGVTGSWNNMFQAVARAHHGKQQQAGSSAEEEFIPGGPQRIGML